MGNMFCDCLRENNAQIIINDSCSDRSKDIVPTNNSNNSGGEINDYPSSNATEYSPIISKLDKNLLNQESNNNEEILKLNNSEDLKNNSKRTYKFCSKHSTNSINEDLFIIGKPLIIGKGQGNIKNLYEFQKKIGAGSYGSVYCAKHKPTGELRAIKIIRKKKEGRSEWINDDIIREIDFLKSIDHPNIIKIFEFYEGIKMFYIVTEFCNGGELFQKLKKEGGQKEVTAALIMYQLFSAINYCHLKKIMHRDLKPENIMLEDQTKNGMLHVKIIDFGTATIYEQEFEQKMIGTLYYIAPEVIDKKYDEKCDLWSLGVIMYVLLSGKLPFGSGNDRQKIFDNIKKCKYDMNTPPLNKITKEAKYLIEGLLKVDPKQRISIDECINSEWFKKNKIKEKLVEMPVKVMRKLLNNIKYYHPDKILQQTALAYLVHNFPQLEEVQYANSLFAKIDINNDSTISKNEFLKGLKYLFNEQNDNINDDFLEELFYIIDTDCSSDLEYEEFVRAAVDKRKFLEENNLKFAFNFFDKDKNGCITLDEVKEIFSAQNKDREFPQEDFQIIIDEVDSDGDGVIDFDEFTKMMNEILN